MKKNLILAVVLLNLSLSLSFFTHVSIADWTNPPVSINSSPGAVDIHYNSGIRRIVRIGSTVISLAPQASGSDYTYRSTDNGSSWSQIDTDGSFSGCLITGPNNYVYHFYVSGSSIYMVRFLYDAIPGTPVSIYTNSAVSNSNTAEYRSVNATIDGNGYLYVVAHWGNPDNLYLLRSTDNGTTWSSPIQVSSGTGSWYYPHIEATSSNDLLVTYRLFSPPTEGVFGRSTDHGTTWTLTNFGSNDVNNLSVLPITSSKYFIFAQRSTPSPIGLVYKVSNDSGTTWSAWTLIEGTLGAGYADPTAALGSDGTIYVTYRNDANTGALQWRNHLARSTDGGITWEVVYDYDEATDRTGARNSLRYQTWYNYSGPLDWSWMQYTSSGTQRPIYFNTNSDVAIQTLGVGQVSFPSLPRYYINTTYSAPTGATCTAANSSEFQTCLNNAALNSTIVLQAGTTYTGPFTLPNKTSGSGWIYIVSSNLANLPAAGTRVSPSNASDMPTLVTGSNPVITAASNAHHYRFVGIHMRPTTGTFVYQIVQIGSGEASESLLPRNITFDRCYIHGDPTFGGRRGIAMDGASIAVVDSYLSDFKEGGADTQTVYSSNGSGPFKIVNNYLEAAGENILFGGSDSVIANLVPSDIEIKRNYFFKPLSWIGQGWSIKNLLEFKNARRALIEGNVFENAPLGAQSGFGVLFTVRNQSGGNPWADVSDMTFRYNKLYNFGSGINIMGRDLPGSGGGYSQISSRLLIENNLMLITRLNGADGRILQITGGPRDITYRHNTGLVTVSGGTMSFSENVPVADQFDYRNNLVSFGNYGFSGTGTGTGLPTLNTYFSNWILTNNAIIGPNYNSSYPSGNLWPSNTNAVGFVDYAGGNYRLTSSSPYHNAGTDGKDLGADIDAIEAAIGQSIITILAPTNLRILNY